ncbi:GCN5 family acetyltransferase [Lentinula edodes]|uniref:GCN5 family acetyltransferase n=1 Tax=Lentinula edodes TaxID=5353 RepID=A0A1Q3DZD1_LENED|nr:GCN5 family acetyltransferase [Lentinula edodes]
MTSSSQNGITQNVAIAQNGTIVHNILNRITVKLCPPSSEAYRSIIPQLAVLLKSCVDTNITMNFLQPFSIQDASAFWLSAEEKVVQMKQFVLIAQESQEAQEKEADDHDFRHEKLEPPVILGCVILYLAQTPNAKHRGEVGKLIIGSEHRKRGIGKMLLDRMEDEARKHSLKILVLDTQTGSGAELFYERVGYSKVGVLPDVNLAPDRGQYTSCTFFYKRL